MASPKNELQLHLCHTIFQLCITFLITDNKNPAYITADIIACLDISFITLDVNRPRGHENLLTSSTQLGLKSVSGQMVKCEQLLAF